MTATEKITLTIKRDRKKDFLKLISRYDYIKVNRKAVRKIRKKKTLSDKEIMQEIYSVRYGVKK